jgi:hypothetical protein
MKQVAEADKGEAGKRLRSWMRGQYAEVGPALRELLGGSAGKTHHHQGFTPFAEAAEERQALTIQGVMRGNDLNRLV